MGTIVPRGDAYRAVVRLKGHPTQTKTFEKRAHAKTWIAETEVALRKREIASRGISVGSLFTRYLKEVAPLKKIADDTKRAFEHIEKTTGDLYLVDLNHDSIVSWKNKYHPNAGGPSMTRYLTRIGTVLATAEALWDVTIPWKEWRRLKFNLKNFGVTSRGKSRMRRLQPGELDLIKSNISSTLPVSDMIDLALDTCLRSGEMTRLRWADIDRDKRTILVRERKHPTMKQTNDQVIPLLGDALAIIDRQPDTNDLIFPFDSDSVEAAWRRARNAAGVEDLKFHDLRHEGISRLFEKGYQIQEVAIVSGHKSWNSLKIYTNLKPESLHRDELIHVQV